MSKRKSKRNKTIFFVIAGICVLALIAEGLLLAGVFSKKKNPEKKGEKEPAEVTKPVEVTKEPTEEPTKEPPKDTITVWREKKSTMYEGDKEYPLSEVEYDENGNETRRVTYSGTDLDSEVVSTYDQENRITRRETRKIYSWGGGQDASLFLDLYTYYENGDLKETVSRMSGAVGMNESKTEYTYDEMHRKTSEKQWLDTSLEEYTIATYEYNTIGKIALYQRVNSDGTDEWVTHYEYDSKGNCIREYGGSNSEGNSSQTLYTYDSKGNKIREVYYYNDQIISALEYQYDNAGRMVQKFYGNAPSDNLDHYNTRYSYEYSDNGRLLRQTEYYGITAVLSDIGYEYDENGCVAKEINYESDGSVKSTAVYEYQAFELLPSQLTEREREWLAREQGQ
ncbi:MAG: hypothetical protein J5845_05285 [Lachnospiraceae bacterium]|nr:hypothetical protein [Lachnospiraceae bacterium]